MGRARNSPPFALDDEARLRDLGAAGFSIPRQEVWRTARSYPAAALVELYRTFSVIQALEAERRETFLQRLATIANEQFGGHVERTFVTVLYTAQKPLSSSKV